MTHRVKMEDNAHLHAKNLSLLFDDITLTSLQSHIIYVTGHEKIGLMCTQNLTTFLDFKLK